MNPFEQLSEATDLIRRLIDNLPNSNVNKGEDWDWAWNELDSTSQASVTQLSREAEQFLLENT